VRTRWATFDCYGTLIDWNAGIGRELERLFGSEAAPRLLARYHALEPAVQAEDPARSYRDVLTRTLVLLARGEGLALPADEADSLPRSLPGWTPFPDVPAELAELRRRGWLLCILSNSDRDLIEASIAQIGVPFEREVVASEIGSYKPAPGHWQAFEREVGRLPDVHVAASLFHDVAPANELGIPCVWINRLDEAVSSERPALELPDLHGLPDAIDQLVPA
jgi:2-haloacid dehalogenase